MKLVILGNSGSGKTWLANRIANVTHTPVVHLDEFFWQPGGFNAKRSATEIAESILRARALQSWIVEGVFGELAEAFLPDAHAMLWLDMDWKLCHQRIRHRGNERAAEQGGEQFDAGTEKLVAWAADYFTRTDKRSHIGHHLLFDGFGGSKLRLTDTEAVEIHLSTYR
ncbi:MAG: hypothetical protein PGN26_15520 [Xylophilus ampelinus]